VIGLKTKGRNVVRRSAGAAYYFTSPTTT